eukprot:jgi/Botrbrau1/5146/Bobra.0172s0018.1
MGVGDAAPFFAAHTAQVFRRRKNGRRFETRQMREFVTKLGRESRRGTLAGGTEVPATNTPPRANGALVTGKEWNPSMSRTEANDYSNTRIPLRDLDLSAVMLMFCKVSSSDLSFYLT